MEAQGFSKSLLVKRYENSIPSRMKVWKERLAVHKLWRSDESRDELHRQNRSDGRRGSSADIHTWMLWPVLGDDGLSPTSPPASASVKGVNKLAPLLLCAPCKPTSHRKNQNSTQWYVQQVNNTQRNTTPNEFVILVLLCPLVRLPYSLSLSIFCLFFCLFYLPFIFFFPFFLFSSFFSSRLFVTRYFLFAVAWLWLVPFSFRSSFSRTYFALRFSFFSFFFLFLKRVESRFTAVLGYVTLSVYKGK